jgi:glutaredoxin
VLVAAAGAAEEVVRADRAHGGRDADGRVLMRPVVTLYTRVGCHLCERAEAVLREAQAATPFELQLVDVDGDPELTRRYGVRVPVVAIDGVEHFEFEVPHDQLVQLLEERTPR